MKAKLILVVIALITFMYSCANYPVAQQSGKEDIAYLLFTSNKEYSGETVLVTLDNDVKFNAKVIKEKKSNRKGTQYSVATGKREIKVEKDGKIIYKKIIFLSNQETKKIVLP